MSLFAIFPPPFTAQCLSFVCALALPTVSASMYFYYTVDNSNKSNNSNNTIRRNEESDETKSVAEFQIDNIVTNSTTQIHSKSIFSYQRAFALLWTHFKTAFSNKLIILWSVWWALATCGMYQVGSFVHVILYNSICDRKACVLNQENSFYVLFSYTMPFTKRSRVTFNLYGSQLNLIRTICIMAPQSRW